MENITENINHLIPETNYPGQRLQQLIKERNMTQTEFAKRVGITQPRVSKYLKWGSQDKTGRTPNSDTLHKMADVLGVSQEEITGENNGNAESVYRTLMDTLNANRLFYDKDDKIKIIMAFIPYIKDESDDGNKTDSNETARRDCEAHPGKQLKKFIDRSGYSQRQFAFKAGITPTAVSAYLKWGDEGARVPKYETVKKMAEVLGVSYDDFFHSDDSIENTKEASVRKAVSMIKKYRKSLTSEEIGTLLESLMQNV